MSEADWGLIEQATGVPGPWRFEVPSFGDKDSAEDVTADIRVLWGGSTPPVAYRISLGGRFEGDEWDALAAIVAGQHGHPMAFQWRRWHSEQHPDVEGWWCKVGRLEFAVVCLREELWKAGVSVDGAMGRDVGSSYQSREAAMSACSRALGVQGRHTREDA